MASEPPTSFSTGRRVGIAFGVVIGFVAAAAILVMLNYISQNFFFMRRFVSTDNRLELSPQTMGLLKSVTNEIRVTLYYDRNDPLYRTVGALLNEYHLANPRLTVETVDYTSSPAEAQRIKAQYKLDSPTDKNLVIFDCAGRVKMVNGDSMMDYTPERVPNKEELEFRKRPVAFKGEMICSALLLGVTNPKPLKASYLIGHGEHALSSGDEPTGYLKFASGVVLQNFVQIEPLSLLGTNTVPADCGVLIIAGPTKPLAETELAKIEQYLEEGGRLLMLFNYETAEKEIGMEKLLAKWGVNVTSHKLVDEQNSLRGKDVVVRGFSKHPVVNALQASSIHVIWPREISRLESATAAADAPTVDEIALTGPGTVVDGEAASAPKPRSIAVALEKGAVKAINNGRGTTRMVVAGDSIFLGNQLLDSAANRDFQSYALNWLLDRTQLLEGPGPKKVTEFTMAMTRSQLKSANAILLLGMPAAVLLLGLIVRWQRRN